IFLISACSVFSPVSKDHPGSKKQSTNKKYSKPSPDLERSKIKYVKEGKKKGEEKISYTLSDITFSKKNNGILISISYEGDDPEKNIHTFFSGDSFFSMTFYKGNFTQNVKNKIYSRNVVRNIQFFEFDDSVQITLRLKKDHNSSTVSVRHGIVNISIYD
ncbi:MAG: hypothetical protein R6V47_06100, partial [Candidatus Delongbacteria bacterium]